MKCEGNAAFAKAVRLAEMSRIKLEKYPPTKNGFRLDHPVRNSLSKQAWAKCKRNWGGVLI
jgi:hypothetical protein